MLSFVVIIAAVYSSQNVADHRQLLASGEKSRDITVDGQWRETAEGYFDELSDSDASEFGWGEAQLTLCCNLTSYTVTVTVNGDSESYVVILESNNITNTKFDDDILKFQTSDDKYEFKSNSAEQSRLKHIISRFDPIQSDSTGHGIGQREITLNGKWVKIYGKGWWRRIFQSKTWKEIDGELKANGMMTVHTNGEINIVIGDEKPDLDRKVMVEATSEPTKFNFSLYGSDECNYTFEPAWEEWDVIVEDEVKELIRKRQSEAEEPTRNSQGVMRTALEKFKRLIDSAY